MTGSRQPAPPLILGNGLQGNCYHCYPPDDRLSLSYSLGHCSKRVEACIAIVWQLISDIGTTYIYVCIWFQEILSTAMHAMDGKTETVHCWKLSQSLIDCELAAGNLGVIYRAFFYTGPPPKSSKYKKVNLG